MKYLLLILLLVGCSEIINTKPKVEVFEWVIGECIIAKGEEVWEQEVYKVFIIGKEKILLSKYRDGTWLNKSENGKVYTIYKDISLYNFVKGPCPIESKTNE